MIRTEEKETDSPSDEVRPSVILVVDDDPANLSVMSDYLKDFGYRVIVARDGESALARAEYGKPDLILLDVLMPKMDGYETCRLLKAREDIRDIPVIFMTALAETSDKVTAFQSGGVDYVTKPFLVNELIARVQAKQKAILDGSFTVQVVDKEPKSSAR